MSRGCARSLKKECADLVVGPVVLIVEKDGRGRPCSFGEVTEPS